MSVIPSQQAILYNSQMRLSLARKQMSPSPKLTFQQKLREWAESYRAGQKQLGEKIDRIAREEPRLCRSTLGLDVAARER